MNTVEEVTTELGRKPISILNKLGVLVKSGSMTRSPRSRAPKIGGQPALPPGKKNHPPPPSGPRSGSPIEGYRDHKACWAAAIDIRDAFLNIPVGKDRFALTAAKPTKEPRDEQ